MRYACSTAETAVSVDTYRWNERAAIGTCSMPAPLVRAFDHHVTSMEAALGFRRCVRACVRQRHCDALDRTKRLRFVSSEFYRQRHPEALDQAMSLRLESSEFYPDLKSSIQRLHSCRCRRFLENVATRAACDAVQIPYP